MAAEIPRLHPDTIEAVREQSDIVDVISDRVALRKRGRDYLGLCPFHDEKTPSFSVSPSKQLYYCFGCGAGGNVFKFLMETGQQSFADVVLDLAKRYSVPIKTLEPERHRELQRQLTLREQLHEILAVAANFYQHALHQPQGRAARDYLIERRGLSDSTLQTFQLGYAPAGWDTLHRYLVEHKRYPEALVEQVGLIQPRKSGSGYIDRFRNRIAIPIADAQGRTIGFGSRALTPDDEPKYLNSPETPLFDKSNTLFALDKARSAIAKQDCAIVVEGYFDAIALHAAGIANTVAALGTAFTDRQLRQVLRFTESKQVVLNFDADAAGIKATQRAITDVEALVYSGHVQLRVLNLPDGKDADEFLRVRSDATRRNPAQQYRDLLDSAPLWLDWQIDCLVDNRDLKHADQYQQVAKGMVQLLARLDDATQRAHYLRTCADRLSQGDARTIDLYSKSLLAQIERLPRRNGRPVGSATAPEAASTGELLARAEALLLAIYLHCPDRRTDIAGRLEREELFFSLAPHRTLWQHICDLETADPTLCSDFGNRLLARLQDRLASDRALAPTASLLQLDEAKARDLDRASVSVRAAIAALEQVTCEKRKRYCLEQWQQLDPVADADRSQYYYQEFYNAQRRSAELARQRSQIPLTEILNA
ncbi:DNA primase, catalytic core [Rubidibacter lacunae KORDI 51-2]|uniref:DNA primase n=1 Tax=Rubidibacter lacunae KORDI 51-2 TaxID=582515 RepID=U5DB73_9CHRO|nr:DNA primase [Rubidibacter lacunae]ERN41793.1 DNA primase, catalytic core [Rubidibacter lacunae KORDI 51-2]